MTSKEHQAWIATGPRDSRFRNVVLRMVAMRMRYEPEGTWKFVVQPHGFPEEPLVSEFLTEHRIKDYLECSSKEGWTIEVDPAMAEIEAKHKAIDEYGKAYKARKRAEKHN